jgi:alpha-L-fucosidase
MLRLTLLAIGISVLSISCVNQNIQQSPQSNGLYAEDWESLGQYNEEPDWFKDAKFGIYFHWGVYSVPAYGSEWYPRMMHVEGLGTYEHHLEKYGHPSEFGYHDFVPMFKAENFDPQGWADLFLKAGAKFAGPVAEHHDGFSMWDSEATPWNSMDKGPGRDVTGELEEAIRARGMKFITTFHHARNLQRYKGLEEEVITREKNIYNQFRKSHYPLYPGMPPTLDDPELNYLYGNIPEAEWLEKIWYGKLVEVVDQYRPDIIYFDSWLNHIPESMRLKFCDYYLSKANEWGKEVVIVRKQNDLPLEYSVDDLEKTRKNHLAEKAWMTDETISNGSWCYTENLQIKSSRNHLHVLIDIVSKNGILLLNISPRADGTIPEDQRQVLLEMGTWLKQYGEAIYETRPWYTFGEGPTLEPEGKHPGNAFQNIKYSSEDIRYTTSGDIVYAIFLGPPPAGQEILLKAFARENLVKRLEVMKVSIPGSDNVLKWNQTKAGLLVHIPESGLNNLATVLKIENQL